MFEEYLWLASDISWCFANQNLELHGKPVFEARKMELKESKAQKSANSDWTNKHNGVSNSSSRVCLQFETHQDDQTRAQGIHSCPLRGHWQMLPSTTFKPHLLSKGWPPQVLYFKPRFHTIKQHCSLLTHTVSSKPSTKFRHRSLFGQLQPSTPIFRINPMFSAVGTARIKLEQAEAAAKVAEKSKLGAEKKLKSAEQDRWGQLGSMTSCVYIYIYI